MEIALVIILIVNLVFWYVTRPKQRSLPDDVWPVKSYTSGEGADRYIYLARGRKMVKNGTSVGESENNQEAVSGDDS